MVAVVESDMYRAVYNHLYDMNERIVRSVFKRITPELQALMSHDAYKEMIQLAQEGYIKSYYERLLNKAV